MVSDVINTSYQITVNVDTQKHLRLDVVVLDRGGFTVLVDGVAEGFAKDVDELKLLVSQTLDVAFKLFRKDDGGNKPNS